MIFNYSHYLIIKVNFFKFMIQGNTTVMILLKLINLTTLLIHFVWSKYFNIQFLISCNLFVFFIIFSIEISFGKLVLRFYLIGRFCVFFGHV